MSDAPTRIADVLRAAKAAGVDRLDAQLLLGHLLGRPRSWLIAHDDAALDAAQSAALDALLARRAAGEPLAYLVGVKAFHGVTLQVTPDVLVPRPETELLVDWALARLAQRAATAAPPRVVDLGTGSGAVALAIKRAAPDAAVFATDVSPAALGVAAANAGRLGLDVTLRAGSWWDAVDDGPFDLVVSNPPYIAGADPHLDALGHEPALALSPGGDGLGALREIVAGAPAHLAPGGWLLVEHGHDQGAAVRELMCEHGFSDVATRVDLAGHGRCTGGRRR